MQLINCISQKEMRTTINETMCCFLMRKLATGKHKGEFFTVVFKKDPNYVEWVLCQEGLTPLSLRTFADFCTKMKTTNSEENII